MSFTTTTWVTWAAVLLGQIVVAVDSYRRSNRSLAWSLILNIAASLGMMVTTFIGGPFAVGNAYLVATVANFAAEGILLLHFYRTVRRTGLPAARLSVIQAVAAVAGAITVLSMVAPLHALDHRPWHFSLLAEHAVSVWIALMLVALPAYAWLVDAAPCNRLVFLYLGLTLYVIANSTAVDLLIANLPIKKAYLGHVPDWLYLVTLVLWYRSSRHPLGQHAWDERSARILRAVLRRPSPTIDPQVQAR